MAEKRDEKPEKFRQPEPSGKKVTSSIQKGWTYAEVAFQYGAAIVLCALIGYWADSKFGTNGIFLIIGVFLGATAGFIGMLRTLKVLDYTKKKTDIDKKP